MLMHVCIKWFRFVANIQYIVHFKFNVFFVLVALFNIIFSFFSIRWLWLRCAGGRRHCCSKMHGGVNDGTWHNERLLHQAQTRRLFHFIRAPMKARMKVNRKVDATQSYSDIYSVELVSTHTLSVPLILSRSGQVQGLPAIMAIFDTSEVNLSRSTMLLVVCLWIATMYPIANILLLRVKWKSF